MGFFNENHKQMSQLSKEECIEELKGPHDKVKELKGIEESYITDTNKELITRINANSLIFKHEYIFHYWKLDDKLNERKYNISIN